MKQVIFALGLLALLGSGQASAAVSTCDGFVDVSGSSSFCGNVEYLVNRSITVGCTDSTHFCPTDYVTRLSMAAFLNRLGTAVQPVFLHQFDTVSIPANSASVICQTPSTSINGFARTAVGDASYFVVGTTGGGLRGRLVYSLNGGAWTNMAVFYIGTTIAANVQAAGSSTSDALRVEKGTTVQFGLSVTTDLTGSGIVECEIRVRLDSASDLPPAVD